MTTAPERPATPARPDSSGAASLDRRHFVGYVVAGSTLAVAADLSLGAPSEAAVAAAAKPMPVKSAPQIPATYDLEDLETQAALPTAQLVTITVDKDGVAHYALPRTEVGQGITTPSSMIIAEELDIPMSKVEVTLSPARPELAFNMLTGGSNTTNSTYTPIRVAAALAKGALLDAAAAILESQVSNLQTKSGVITEPSSGRSVTYGEAAVKAASPTTKKVDVTLKPASQHTVVGTPRNRIDARDIVTGKKQFAMDLKVPGALPTMICRPPTHNGKPTAINNAAAVKAMPGVTDVAMIPTGVAVRAETFGQCIDAVRALKVTWAKGTVEGLDDAAVLKELKANELPLAVPKVPLLAKTVEISCEFMFRSGAALEPGCAVADYKDGTCTVWGGVKVPIDARNKIAAGMGMLPANVTVNVITGGGSFGHKLFPDAAVEAGQASKAFGKPVRLMWHRCDEPRQGRSHPMATSRIRATVLGGSVLSFEQRHTSVSTDFRHGLGEIISASAASLPSGLGNEIGFSESVFLLTQELGYDFGVVTQLLNETKNESQFQTSSVRNIYSPDVRTTSELMVDKLAKEMGLDPVEFRLAFLRDERTKAVLNKVAEVANWGKTMPAGTAQGVAIHQEYKGCTATIIELDCRPQTVNRKIRDGIGGPRVMRGTIVVDAGLVINPRGLEAQMMGGMSDGIAQALTSSSHLKNGAFLEGSWDNFFYTREWNAPLAFQCVVMKSDSEQPGGAGEAGVASSMAATAGAYMRATGKTPTRFPILHDETPKHFEVKPYVPPIPPSPTDGLQHTF